MDSVLFAFDRFNGRVPPHIVCHSQSSYVGPFSRSSDVDEIPNRVPAERMISDIQDVFHM